MADQDNRGKNGPMAPHYDPSDETGNSKEIAKPAARVGDNPAQAALDPERRKRAEEVLGNFEGEAVRPQPDGF